MTPTRAEAVSRAAQLLRQLANPEMYTVDMAAVEAAVAAVFTPPNPTRPVTPREAMTALEGSFGGLLSASLAQCDSECSCPPATERHLAQCPRRVTQVAAKDAHEEFVVLRWRARALYPRAAHALFDQLTGRLFEADGPSVYNVGDALAALYGPAGDFR